MRITFAFATSHNKNHQESLSIIRQHSANTKTLTTQSDAISARTVERGRRRCVGQRWQRRLHRRAAVAARTTIT